MPSPVIAFSRSPVRRLRMSGLVLDVTDPYNPVETGRYHQAGPDFEFDNGGIQDVWGIYKVPNEPWIYASDRNGGLYVLKEYGAGSAKVAKK